MKVKQDREAWKQAKCPFTIKKIQLSDILHLFLFDVWLLLGHFIVHFSAAVWNVNAAGWFSSKTAFLIDVKLMWTIFEKLD